MQAARPLLSVFAVSGALITLAGCGSASDSSSVTGSSKKSEAPAGVSVQNCAGAVAGVGQLRVTGVGCDVGRGVAAVWANKPACARPASASRYSCAVFGDYRCLGAATERGIVVSCAQPNRSIAFLAKRG